MSLEKMSFLEMTNLDERIDTVAINCVEDFIDENQNGQIADDSGDFVVEFSVITPLNEIKDADDLLDATIEVEMSQFN